MTSPTALYVHVPFCSQVCPYCAFNVTSRYDDGLLDRFLRAIGRELSGLASARPLKLKSLYLGGGTPTALDARRLDLLLGLMKDRTDPGSIAEWTVEANPDALTSEHARVLKNEGVTRVSLGAQSFQKRFLHALGRTHGPDDVRESIRTLRSAGLANLNVDLMYGLPSQTLDAWVQDVEAAIGLGVEHVSLYELTFEEGTPFARGLDRGRIPRADDSLAVAMFRAARERLSDAGIEWYEISNFAKPGFESEHNRNYWRNDPYFGVGPGAFGCVDDVRTTNVRDVAAWCRQVETTGTGIEEREPLGARDTFVETLAAGLRTRDGVDLAALRTRTGMDVLETHRDVLEKLKAGGLAAWTSDRLRLTLEGVLLLDSILLDFVEPARGPGHAPSPLRDSLRSLGGPGA
jgi:oxygen-independent coproporphyrinogen-3 oxidase